MARCDCDLCKIGRRLEKISKKLSKKDAHFLLNDLFGLLEDTMMEADYRKALLDGTWPESKPINKVFLKWKKERFENIP